MSSDYRVSVFLPEPPKKKTTPAVRVLSLKPLYESLKTTEYFKMICSNQSFSIASKNIESNLLRK